MDRTNEKNEEIKKEDLSIRVTRNSSSDSAPSPPSPIERPAKYAKRYSMFYNRQCRRVKRELDYKSDTYKKTSSSQWYSPRCSTRSIEDYKNMHLSDEEFESIDKPLKSQKHPNDIRDMS